LTALSVVSSSLVLEQGPSTGFADSRQDVMLDYATLLRIYANTPGLEADRLKNVLETVAVIQKSDIPFMLVLTGLPTLFPKLVEARTFAERMFRVITLDKLEASRNTITRNVDTDFFAGRLAARD
jgi:hypothetical protein